MPNIKSAIKRVKTAEQRRERNKALKSSLKTQLKKFDKAVEEKAENLKEIAVETQKSIDKACSKGIIHKNAASRKNSHVASRVNKTL